MTRLAILALLAAALLAWRWYRWERGTSYFPLPDDVMDILNGRPLPITSEMDEGWSW